MSIDLAPIVAPYVSEIMELHKQLAESQKREAECANRLHEVAVVAATAEQERDRLREALEIYATGRHWKAINSARETTFHPDIVGGFDRFGPKHGYEIAKQALDVKAREVNK